MAILNIAQTLGRVREATEESMIALFECNCIGGVRSVFHSTVETEWEIRHSENTYIGSYHRHSDMTNLRAVLHARVKHE